MPSSSPAPPCHPFQASREPKSGRLVGPRERKPEASWGGDLQVDGLGSERAAGPLIELAPEPVVGLQRCLRRLLLAELLEHPRPTLRGRPERLSTHRARGETHLFAIGGTSALRRSDRLVSIRASYGLFVPAWARWPGCREGFLGLPIHAPRLRPCLVQRTPYKDLLGVGDPHQPGLVIFGLHEPAARRGGLIVIRLPRDRSRSPSRGPRIAPP
jgi:hypothetical protein